MLASRNGGKRSGNEVALYTFAASTAGVVKIQFCAMPYAVISTRVKMI